MHLNTFHASNCGCVVMSPRRGRKTHNISINKAWDWTSPYNIPFKALLCLYMSNSFAHIVVTQDTSMGKQ